MLQLKRNLLSVALASATLMLATGVHAQTTVPPQTAGQAETEAERQAREAEEARTLDTVVVTGIRAAIENSIETKQQSTSIVESVSAEDIGKLPDTSIADSIARLPGLTAQRFGGRPQEINIRGFAGDFSTTLLNGREQVSLGNNRGVEFDQYPSELVNQVVVYKTPDGSLIGQGLSGTVDIRTVRPLDFDERVVALNFRADHNKIGNANKAYGNRYSVSYIDQFADNTIGLALGYAHLNNPGQGHQFEAWGYDNGAIGGGKLYDIENENERDGFMGVLEYRPNDMYSTSLDVFYSKFDKEEFKRGMEFGLAWGSAGQPIRRVDNANGTAVDATWTNFKPVLRNDFNATYDDLFAIAWKNEFKFGDAWKLTADLSHSEAERDERILETYAGLAPGLSDTVRGQLNSEGYFDFGFGLDYGDPSILRLTDAGGWGQDGYIKDFEVKDELDSARLDLEYSFASGFLSSLEFGANLTDRSKSRSSNEAKLCLVACAGGDSAPVPVGMLGNPFFGFGGLSNLINYNANDTLGSIYQLQRKDHPDIFNKNWEVNEKVTTAYLQANIDTELGSIGVRGNVGVQAVRADQDSTGVATFEGVALSAPSQRGATYTDYLPSLNLSFHLPWDQYVRVGAARQMARPRMDDLRANAGFGIDRTRDIWTGGGGNPELAPWIADAYDISWEKYFGTKAYVSAAYFRKDLKTYIYNQTTPFDFSQLPVPAGVLPADIPPSPIGEFNQPVNGEGGVIKGIELALSVPFEMLWKPLEGFGLVANYSDTKSEIHPDGPGTTAPLPGLSKYVSNVTVYFERHGFSTRVSQRHRSAFAGEVQGFGGDRTRRTFDAETVSDFQMGYAFQGGQLEGLSVLLQINNLENEPFRGSFDGRDDRPREFFEYGRTYLVGVNYKF